MGLFYPNPKSATGKIGWGHWLRVAVILAITALLTWYGKFYKPEPSISRNHGFAAWALPHKGGLGVLVALPDDGNDSNTVETGLQLWFNPPDSGAAFLERNGVRYGGAGPIVVKDSLTWQRIASTLAGTDVEILGWGGKPYTVDILHKGYRLRFWSSSALAAADSMPVSAGFDLSGPSLILEGDTLVLGDGEMALVALEPSWKTMKAQKLHLKGWKADF
jgi:hypothetical protein